MLTSITRMKEEENGTTFEEEGKKIKGTEGNKQ